MSVTYKKLSEVDTAAALADGGYVIAESGGELYRIPKSAFKGDTGAAGADGADGVDGVNAIDDTSTAADKLWSAQKISAEITALSGTNERMLSKTYTGSSPDAKLVQGSYSGFLTRIVNPKKKITRIKARAYFMEAGTATIGVLAGSTIFSGTVYADTMDFYASGTAAVTTVNTAADVDVTFSEPVDVDDDYLYIALWNSAGGARWMNASINTEVVSEVQDSTRNYYMQRYGSTERVYVRLGDSYSAYGKSAALELYTLENPTEQSITELDTRVTALEATAATTNPLNVLRPDGGFCNIFKSITCIGDSLTKGVMEYTVDDVTTYPGYDDYSYPTFMRRALGCTVNNLSFGGATAIRWLAWANTNNYFADKKADAYIIALGTNDLDSSTGNITGEITDINTTDPTLTDVTTDLGAYGKIIQNIYAEVPRAKIFIVTIPKTRNYAPWNAVVNAKYKALAELLGCYVIDLETYGVQTDDVADFKAVYYNGGHLNALGYYNLAVRYMSYIDWIIRNNFADFKQTAFIQGYPSSGTTDNTSYLTDESGNILTDESGNPLLPDDSESGGGESGGGDEPDTPTGIWQNNQLTETFSAAGAADDYIDTGFVPFAAENNTWTIMGRVSKTTTQPTDYCTAFCEGNDPGNFGLKASVYDGSWIGQTSGVTYLMLKVTGNWGNFVGQFIPVTDIAGDHIDFAFVRNGNDYAIYYNGTLGEALTREVNAGVTEHLLIGASWNRYTGENGAAFRTGTFTCPFFKIATSVMTQAQIAAEFAAIV